MKDNTQYLQNKRMWWRGAAPCQTFSNEASKHKKLYIIL